MAGFPPRSSKSHEYPYVSCVSVSPVSAGQTREEELKALAAANGCTELNTARIRSFKLARDVRTIEKRIGRDLEPMELRTASNERHRLSQRFLDPAKTHDGYFAAFLAEL